MHTTEQRWSCYTKLTSSQGLWFIARSRNQVYLILVRAFSRLAIVDIFCTYYQNSNLDWEVALPFSNGSGALGSMTWYISSTYSLRTLRASVTPYKSQYHKTREEISSSRVANSQEVVHLYLNDCSPTWLLVDNLVYINQKNENF